MTDPQRTDRRQQITVEVGITSADPSVIARAVESFTRAATGLALEGVYVCVQIGPAPDDDDED